MSLFSVFNQSNRSKLRVTYEKTKFRFSQMASREIDAFASLRSAYYLDFWQRTADRIGSEIEILGDAYLLIKKKDKHTFVKDYEVSLDNHLILKIAGNKHMANQLMNEAGFPVPRFYKYTIGSVDKAVEFMHALGKKVVVKPSGGGGGRGVSMSVDTPDGLKKATHYASIFGNSFIVEEQIEGASFRLLYLNEKFIDAIRRDPPVITGDGTHTIAQLIDQTNKKRLEQKPVTALSPLTVNFALLEKLKMQGLTLAKVLEAGETIVVNSVVNQNSAAENHIVRDQVHPEIIEMGSRVVKYFGIELAGLDIIAETLSEPLQKTGGIINEINTTPGLHHHDLVAESDKKINVGKVILDYIFNQDQVHA